MAALAVMIGGIIAYGTLAVDLLPSVKFPYVSIVTAYPGAGPSEVEARVTKPLENAVAGSSGVKNIFSTSGDSYSILVLEYQEGTDPDAAIQDVERRINQIQSSLPDDVKTPAIAKEDLAAQPIVILGANWDTNPEGLYPLADDTIRPRLEAIDGVASVQVRGGREREIQVRVDRDRLEARGLSLAQVTAALAANNLSAPSGYVQEGTSEYSLRVYGLYQELEQLGNLELSPVPTGGVVRLKDVATIQDSFKKQDFISRVNGREGVAILVQKQPTANTVAVAAAVQKTINSLGPILPQGVQITTIQDGSTFVRDVLNSVQNNLRDAALIVALVLLLFLHTWRSTLIVLISIPTSLIATFAVMWLMHFSVNMMSMSALALTIGILVDDSIVILENIYRHMKMGKGPWAAAFEGRAEIGAAAVTITLVDVVVYTPVAFLTGMVGQFFREFGLTIVAATLFSLLVSFTLTPMLASRWLTAADEERSPLAPLWIRWERGYQSLTARYRGLLATALRRRWEVLFLGLLAFLSGVALIALGLVPTEFMTQSDQGNFQIAVDMPPGTSVAGTNQSIQRFEQRIAEIPEVAAFLSTVGVGGQYGSAQHRSARVYVRLKPTAERTRTAFQVAEEVRQIAATIPDMSARVTLPSMVGYTGMAGVQVRVRGADMAVLNQLAAQVEQLLLKTEGTVDVNNSAGRGVPEMRVEIDHQRLTDLGLTTAQVASALRTAFEGTVATELRRESEDKVDIRVLYGSATNGSELASIPDIPLTTPRGVDVKLSQVARLVPVDGPVEISRENRVRQIVVSANLMGRPLGDVTADIRKGIERMEIPAGYEITLGGETELQEDAFDSLIKALGVSILLMFMLMVALYDSLVYPLVIMGALPVASVGAIGALAITHDTLNIMSLVGMIMLTGLVGKNAILLVDYTNTLRKRGYARREALLEAAPIRLRPILMTTTAMVFAMLPLALRSGEGAATRAPLAVVVIGGLLTSTLLTLVVVPAGYTVMDDLQQWLGARLHRKPPSSNLLGEVPGGDATPVEAATAGGRRSRLDAE